MLRCACLLGLIGLSAGCTSTLDAYQCETSRDCVGASEGRCESNGHCSFADETCADGFRFGEAAGSESGSCVSDEPMIVDAGPTAIPDAAGEPASVWRQRHRLVINNAAHDESLIDFPVLIVLTPERVDYGRIKAGGADLRFTNPEGDTQLAFEIEHWDPNGSSYIWVKALEIDASSDSDHIFLYYGNPMAGDGQSRQDVWTNGYEAVFHFSDEGGSLRNSAVPQDSADNVGTTVVAGSIGSGRMFDGSSSHIKLKGGGPVSILQNVSGMTATAWIKPDNLGSQQAYISVATGDGACTNKSRLAALISGVLPDELVFAARSLDSDPLATRSTGSANLVENEWALVSTVVDADLLHNDFAEPYGQLRAVVNDRALDISPNARMAAPATALTEPACVTIGAQDDASGDFFSGVIDEVRISGVDRTTIWLQAQYQSMSDSDFVRFRAAETVAEELSN